LFFLKSNFYIRDNFKFQCDLLSIKKDVSLKGQVATMGACQKWHIFGYFSTKLGTFVDGHEKIII
jgi:hypothetical protein